MVLFAVVLAEQMGLPLPAMPWLLAAGALSARGSFNSVVAIALTVVACLLADSTGAHQEDDTQDDREDRQSKDAAIQPVEWP